MSDFDLIEGSGYQEVRTISVGPTGTYLNLYNQNTVPGLNFYYQIIETDQEPGPILLVPRGNTSSGVKAYNNSSRTENFKIYLKADEDYSGPEQLMTLFYTRGSSSVVYYETLDETVTVTGTPDSPSALQLSNQSVAESDSALQIATLTAQDPDNDGALTFSLVYDASGQLSIEGNRLVARNGLDFEALAENGLITQLANGQLAITVDILVTDPTGRSTSFTKTIQVSDIDEAIVTAGTNAPDVVQGSEFADTLNGAGGDDTLLGAGSDDAITGGVGDDFLDGSQGNDTLSGGKGDDVLRGGEGSDTLNGGQDRDYLSGGRGNDTLQGSSGQDTLNGGRGNDKIYGGSGADRLFDGSGSDKLFGEGGRDEFNFIQDNSLDRVQDFQDGLDVIVLEGVNDFNDLTITQINGGRVFSVTYDNETLLVKMTAGSYAADALGADDFLI